MAITSNPNGTEVSEIFRNIISTLQEGAKNSGIIWSPLLTLMYLFFVKEDCVELVRATVNQFTMTINEPTYGDLYLSPESEQEVWSDQVYVHSIIMALDPEISETRFICAVIEDQRRLWATQPSKRRIEAHYPALIEESIRVATREDKYNGGAYFQPQELTALISRLANIRAGQRIYNPFAGLASFGIDLPSNNYYGQEINHQTWAMGMIRSLAHGKTPPYNYVQEDSLKHWNPSGEPCDLIVANPPFNLPLEGVMPEFGRRISAEVFFLFKSMEDLKSDGKAILVVPNGFLVSLKRGDLAARRKVVDEDLLDLIVTFPGSLLGYTSIPFSLLRIDRNKKLPGTVCMVDADSFIQRGKGGRVIDHEALVAAIDRPADHSEVRSIPIQEIVQNAYILSPQRYALGLPSGMGSALRDVIQNVPSVRTISGSMGKVVRIRDLSSNQLVHELDIGKLEPSTLTGKLRTVKGSALLVSLRGGELRPTWFEYKGEPIHFNSEIHAVSFDTERVDKEYLMHELRSEQVTKQMAALVRGITIQSLNKRDLGQIRIEIPSLDAQRAKVKGFIEAYTAANVLRAEEAAGRYGIQLQAFRNTASFKHIIGTPLMLVSSGVEIMCSSMDKLQPEWRSHFINTDEHKTLGCIVDDLVYELQRISDLLETDNNDLNVEEYPLSRMDLVSYVMETMNRVRLDPGEEHKVSFSMSPDVKEHLKGKAHILGNKALLDIAVNAIVDNARIHAFGRADGPHTLTFFVDMAIVEKRPYANLWIANNGTPFPEGFGVDRFVQKNVYAGPTGHSGIGGYHLSKIVQYHEGRLDLLKGANPDSPLVTIIEIQIPLAD